MDKISDLLVGVFKKWSEKMIDNHENAKQVSGLNTEKYVYNGEYDDDMEGKNDWDIMKKIDEN